MSDTVASLRRKRDAAAKLESVVRAMKALAASSIGQYETALRALGDYELSIELGLHACLRNAALPAETSATAEARPIRAIVFGSDQGLVGRFNEVIADFSLQTLASFPGRKQVWTVGERVYEHLVAAGMSVVGQFAVPGSVDAITALVGQIQLESETRRAAHEYTEIHVFHNRPRSAALYEPVSRRLLPLDTRWARQLTRLRWPTANLPEVLGTNDGTLRALVHEYLFICLYRACAESLASENGSRLAAMQRAQKNIEGLSSVLSQSFYRLRQSSIDEELFDVMSAFKTRTQDTAHGKQS